MKIHSVTETLLYLHTLLSQMTAKAKLEKSVTFLSNSRCIFVHNMHNTHVHIHVNRWYTCSKWGGVAKCSYRKSSSARQAFRALQYADKHTHSCTHMHVNTYAHIQAKAVGAGLTIFFWQSQKSHAHTQHHQTKLQPVHKCNDATVQNVDEKEESIQQHMFKYWAIWAIG